MQWGYDSEAGTWWWELFQGFGVQTTDVGGIALVDFDRAAKVEDLPEVRSRPGSDGRCGATSGITATPRRSVRTDTESF